MKTTLWLVVLAAWLPAQEKADAKAALARAVVIEEQEHDLQGAIAEYQRLAQDPRAPGEVGAEAKLRLGMALLRADNEAEGRAALEEVMAVGGTVAERAKQVLEARNVQDRELEARVQAAIDLLRRDPRKGAEEIRFLGSPAAPALSRQLWSPPFDRAFLAAAVAVLLDLDDAVAADTLARLAKADVYVRRAAATGLKLTGRAKTDAGVLAFLRDADPEVRVGAVRKLAVTAPAADLAAAVADGDVSVREALFGTARDASAAGYGPDRDRAGVLLPVLATEVEQSAPVAAVWAILELPVFPEAPGGMALTLRALRHPRCPWTGAVRTSVSLRPNECIDDALATAEHLAATAANDGRRQRLDGYVRSCEEHWDRAALAQRIRLRALGYGTVEQWLVQHGEPGDLPLVLDSLGAFPIGEGSVINHWLSRQVIPAERWRSFADHATARRERARANAAASNEVFWATYQATSTWHPDAMAWVGQFAPAHASAYAGAARAFGNVETLTPEARGTLISLVAADVATAGAMPDAGTATGQGQAKAVVDGARFQIVQAIVKHGIDEAVPAVVRAHELIAEPENFLNAFERTNQHRTNRLSDDAIASVVGGVLQQGRPGVFEGARGLLPELGRKPSAPVYRAFCQHVLSAPVLDRRGNPLRSSMLQQVFYFHRIDPEAANRLLVAALAHPDRSIGQEATRSARTTGGLRLSRDAIAALVEWLRAAPGPAAIRLLGESGDAELVAQVTPWLAHDDETIRSAAARALSDLLGADSVDALLPLFDDPQEPVRLTICQIAKTHLDRRFVPGLLKLLRDPQDAVRKAAQECLEAIEFYVTQTERWQRLLRGTGLEANTAAEALLGQAKAGNDKRVRLAAIRGLGALGVKEVLPFLIQMMQEQDAEVAAAASEAIDALNKR